MPKLPNTLIIDGHGATYDPHTVVGANYFNFQRSAATKCTLHSYVLEGRLMPARESNEKILWSIRNNGAIPANPVESNASRIGEYRMRDRVILAIDYSIRHDGSLDFDWNYELPSSWGADSVQLNAIEGGTVETLIWYNGHSAKTSSMVWFALRAEGPHTPLRSVLLSTVLNYFNTQSYDVLWMVCREG